MKKIGGLFGRPAYGPVYEHMLKVMDCLGMLDSIIESFIAGDHEKIEELMEETCRLEHDADIIKRGIRESFTKSIFGSSNRGDILTLLSQQDGIADSCQDVARLLTVRKTKLPVELKEDILDLVDKVKDAVEAVSRADLKMIDLLENPSSTDKLEEVVELIEHTQKEEWLTDQVQFRYAKTLFSIEDKLDPVTVIFLMNIMRELGRIADHAENTADCIRRLITK